MLMSGAYVDYTPHTERGRVQVRRSPVPTKKKIMNKIRFYTGYKINPGITYFEFDLVVRFFDFDCPESSESFF